MWSRTLLGLAALVAVGCIEDGRPRTLDPDPRDAGQGALDQGDAGLAVDVAAPRDRDPADAALPDAALPDAQPLDGAVQACVVDVQIIDGAGTPPVACQLAPADAPSCEVLADCLCGLVADVDPDECHWMLAEPRALENLSDWCNGVRSLDDLLRRESWLAAAGPAKFELAWTPACVDFVASF